MLKIFNRRPIKNKMKNLEIWIITFVISIVLIFGVFYYEIIGAVTNAVAFIVSLTIIFLILILVIIFSQQDNKKRKTQKQKVEENKIIPKERLKTSSKKLKVERKR